MKKIKRLQKRIEKMYYLSVPVEDVDELLLLNGADHDGATLGVNCQILTRHNPAVTCHSNPLDKIRR
jgi:hypothetical protein